MPLQPERLDELLSLLEAAMVSASDSDLFDAMGPQLGGLAATLRRLPGPFRVDLPRQIRNISADSLARLRAASARDPVRSDRALARVVHLVAWLDGQTDERPELPDLSALMGRSRPATG